jgi:hypothetical protein
MGELTDEEILHEMYRRSYAASTPYGDWDDLLEKAEIDENGLKHIDYNAYECDIDTLQHIFDTVIDENNISERHERSFSMSFWLGCGPKSKVTKDVIKKTTIKHKMV